MAHFQWRDDIQTLYLYTPPLTPLIHAAIMSITPINYYVVSERALSCILILFYSYLATAILRRIYPYDVSLREHGWIYTSTFFVFSIHNYCPFFAWHTVDGVFFAVTGAWFLL